VPKSLALERTERVPWPCRPWTSYDPGPTLLGLMNGSANLVLRGFGMASPAGRRAHSSEELKLWYGQLPRGRFRKPRSHDPSCVELGNLTVREIKVARNKIFSFRGTCP